MARTKHEFIFGSVAALVAAAEAPTTSRAALDQCARNDSARSNPSWLGIDVKNGAHARRLALEGQPSLTERVRDLPIKLPETLTHSPRRVRVRGETGDTFDLDRVMNGDPECWERMSRADRPNLPRVIVAVDSWMTWSESAETLAWRGACVAKAAEAAALAGFQVTVVNAFSARDWFTDGKEAIVITVVSTPDAPLDVTTMATAVAMPAMTRTIIWNALVRTGANKLGMQSNSHMGSQRDIHPDEIRSALGDYDALMILADRTVCDQSSAERWLATFAATIDADGEAD